MGSEIQTWWAQAEHDLDTARYLFEGRRYKETSFFCQQAAEKALKAVLIKKNQKIVRIHDLVKLAQLVGADSSLNIDCKQLTMVYVDTRYPDTSSRPYSNQEAKEDLQRAVRILQWAEKNI